MLMNTQSKTRYLFLENKMLVFIISKWQYCKKEIWYISIKAIDTFEILCQTICNVSYTIITHASRVSEMTYQENS